MEGISQADHLDQLPIASYLGRKKYVPVTSVVCVCVCACGARGEPGIDAHWK